MKNSDTPAAPLSGNAYQDFAAYDETSNTSYNPQCQGLTKREHFAGLAMQNLLNSFNPYEQGDFDSSDFKETAKLSVGLADALLKELESKEQ